MKKIYIIFCLLAFSSAVLAQTKTKQQKKQERRERIDRLIKQEAEGTIVFSKQNAFGAKLATDGYGLFYELGIAKSITKTNLYWLEIGERKHPKEERKLVVISSGPFDFISGNPFIFGKRNNFYSAKLGFAQQRLIGGKGNKNGVAVSGIYGGGFSAGFLKPYYLEVIENGVERQVKFDSPDSAYFTTKNDAIIGSAGFTKGFNELEFVPGAHAKLAARFDYGKYNEVLSALEVGINAEFYTKPMPIMVNTPEKRFFFNAYVSIMIGKRK